MVSRGHCRMRRRLAAHSPHMLMDVVRLEMYVKIFKWVTSY